jgi:SAM-dependent methyltransferase
MKTRSKFKQNLIKSELLKLYKKNNPSLPTNIKKKIKINEEIFKKLSFPPRFFKNLSVGNFACGTGEFNFVAAKNGAKTEGFDFNEISIDKAKKNSKKLNIRNCTFQVKEFFKVKKKYDFAICTAALHHLPNPYDGLRFLKSRVKKNGFLLVSFGLSSSNIVHNLMKLIVRNWGKDEKKIAKVSKFLFKNHIERCVKHGLRKEAAVIDDQFVNAQHYYLDIKKIFKILNKNFSLHSSWPPKYLPQGDSVMNLTIKNQMFIPSELLWASKTYDDKIRYKKFYGGSNFKTFENLKNILNNKRNFSIKEIIKKNSFLENKNNFNYANLDLGFDLNTHVGKFFNEVYELINFFKTERTLNEAKLQIKKKKYLFKGTNGLGLNYFIFQKK